MTWSVRSDDVAANASAREVAQGVAKLWWVALLLGIGIAVVGLLLLFNLVAAAFTLAALVGLGFLFEGISELMQARRYTVRWPSYLLGAVLVLTGIVALAWPDITLWALAVVTGFGIIIFGIVQVAAAIMLRRGLPAWGVWLAIGLVSIVVGILCIAWPEATVKVLAVILGLRILFNGLSTILIALGLRQVSQALA